MAKLGLARHRYTVAILCWFYVIISLLIHIYCIFDTIINLMIGCFGLLSLYKENGTLMKIFGIILIVVIALQALEMLGLLMLSLFRESILDVFLKELMNKYYESVDDREIMDGIQKDFKCCGRRSYNDWTIQPYTCCTTDDCTMYHSDGCITALSSITLNILLAYGVVCIVSIIVHIYAVVSAFELARVYTRLPVLPSIKHSFANF